jgi:hypothetical protein
MSRPDFTSVVQTDVRAIQSWAIDNLSPLAGAAVKRMPVAQGAADCHLMTLTYTGDMTPWIVEILADSSVQTAAFKRVEA